ncbi:MAG TPA: PP2C family protein-serine/threonine phosphatase [Terriglobales bacterium]|nr:PP2C family protein-serine/threonine phosphatase [Terriglobales bacterium]
MSWKQHQAANIRFWKSLPPLANALFFFGVFSLFASIGFITSPGRLRDGAISAGFSGAIAAGFAFLGTRGRTRAMVALMVLLFVVWPQADRLFHLPVHMQAGQPIAASALGAMIAVITGYILMLVFIGTEGRRYFRLHAEVDLAGQIHRALAPAIACRCGQFEVAGASHPSGEVGGDLLDVVTTPEGWFAYLADVSGHGIAAGVLMSLVKSGARTALDANPSPADVLPTLNRVLAGLLPEESYVTLASVAGNCDATLRFAAAGHPPMLHYQAASGTVAPLTVENFPLGMFGEAVFAATEVRCAPGDIVALFTDGLTEIFKADRREFGQDGLSAVLKAHAAAPLTECVAAMQSAARAWGPQTDDQTLLLLRCLP